MGYLNPYTKATCERLEEIHQGLSSLLLVNQEWLRRRQKSNRQSPYNDGRIARLKQEISRIERKLALCEAATQMLVDWDEK